MLYILNKKMTQSNSDVTGETNLDNFQIEEKKTREKIVTE